MKKNKKVMLTLIFTGGVLFFVWIWLSLRPVNIVAVHEKGNHSLILVKNFPYTDKGKIDWWLKNKDILKEKYQIPKPRDDGFFEVIFWYFGDGYKEEDKYDRLCFEDMAPPINCIEKDKAFTVWMDRYGKVSFDVNDGEYYINKNGDMVKTKYQ
ncbi:membrane protein [Cedecea neteri]|uniref:Membrane protein n=1 Tax=Cedecea neteri TaxID=158822 RepID=A0AAN0S1Z7_9ENTR|nr:DUF943 family protein [Cedecea neteri]AIR59550.1 membrane protein [Cedecea neteri]